MSDFAPLGLSRISLPIRSADKTELLVIQRRLDRIFEHTGFTLDDVVNNPVARNAVLGYFKLSLMIDRRSEIVDLERQWNP
jgi:hypothetical protein